MPPRPPDAGRLGDVPPEDTPAGDIPPTDNSAGDDALLAALEGEPRRRRPAGPRAPVRPTADEPTSQQNIDDARALVRRSGVARKLAPYTDRERGRPAEIPVEALLVVMTLNGFRRGHYAWVTKLAELFNTLTDGQRRALGVGHTRKGHWRKWNPDLAYDRVWSAWERLCRTLDGGHDGIDIKWFRKAFVRASIPPGVKLPKAVAVDATDMPTWAAAACKTESVDLKGAEGLPEGLGEQQDGDKPAGGGKAAKILRRGASSAARDASKKVARPRDYNADGRPLYTKDPDALAGYRSAANARNAGKFLGYHLHAVTVVPDFYSRDGAEDHHYLQRTHEFPHLVLDFTLVGANTHPAKSIVPELLSLKADGVADLTEVVWDRGYSQLDPATWLWPLQVAGIEPTYMLVKSQRGHHPFVHGDALLIDGILYHRLMPPELWNMPGPPNGDADSPESIAHRARADLRARWRLRRDQRPDAEGFTRWKCPFCAGSLRTDRRGFTKNRRPPSTSIRVETHGWDIPRAETCCCTGTQTFAQAAVTLWQRYPEGTTAWYAAFYGRRSHIETANSLLKGGFVNIDRKWVRTWGIVKLTVFLTFAFCGLNRDRVRSWRAKCAEMERLARKGLRHRPRRKRRKGTLDDVAPGTADAARAARHASQRDARPEPQSTDPPT